MRQRLPLLRIVEMKWAVQPRPGINRFLGACTWRSSRSISVNITVCLAHFRRIWDFSGTTLYFRRFGELAETEPERSSMKALSAILRYLNRLSFVEIDSNCNH